jgi:adenylosuccinate lyase
MPHKRNPVICERICGLARLLRANALAASENLALWHERDISHSSVERIILPDSTILLDYMLNKFTEAVEGLLVYPDNMLVNLAKTRGLIFSQRILVALMQKGLPRQKAYDLVQRNSMLVWKKNLNFQEALLEDKEVLKYLTPSQIRSYFNLQYYLRNVNTIFRRLGLN